MKKIITAVNNPILNEKLRKENFIEVIGKDIQYKEGILEILENNKNIDLIIINEKLPGEINLINLLKKIKLINEKIKIILILENENIEKEEKIKKINSNIEIFFNNKINIEKLINLLKEKNIKNEKELEEEIKKLKEIIKNSNLKINNEEKKLKEKNNNNKKVSNYIKIYKRIIKTNIKNLLKIKINTSKNNLHNTFILNNLIVLINLSPNKKINISLSIQNYLSNKNNKIIELKKFTTNNNKKENIDFNIYKLKSQKQILQEIKNNFFEKHKIYRKKQQNKKKKYKIKKIIKNKNNKNIFYYKFKKIKNIKKLINNFSIFFDYIFIKLNLDNLLILNKLNNIEKIKIINIIILEKNINNLKILNKIINKYELNKNKLIIILKENKKEKIDNNIIKKIFKKNKIIILKENKSLKQNQIKKII